MAVWTTLLLSACLLCCSPATGLRHDDTLMVAPRPLEARALSLKTGGAATEMVMSSPLPTATGSPSPPPSPLPVALDSNLSTNFTSSCARFIEQFLSDARFKQCYAVSMLVRGSLSFFNAAKSRTRLTQVLDATCAADPMVCRPYFAGLANDLVSEARCGADFSRGNSVVVESHQGMLAYEPLYQAACLRDATTSQYCYVDAVTERERPTDAYFYFLPLNVSLPAATKPTCDACLHDTMLIYQRAAADRHAAIALTYPGAAMQVDTICGPGFVNQTLPDPLPISAAATVKWGRLVAVMSLSSLACML